MSNKKYTKISKKNLTKNFRKIDKRLPKKIQKNRQSISELTKYKY